MKGMNELTERNKLKTYGVRCRKLEIDAFSYKLAISSANLSVVGRERLHSLWWFPSASETSRSPALYIASLRS